MDKRSWPWKKSSDKQEAEKSNPVSASGNHVDKVKEEKKAKYVQISVESYTRLIGLEDQVKSYEDQVHALEDEISALNERLVEAEAEISSKDSLIKQHTKVAEEAVSGWEKADAEATVLKDHLESITLLKLTAEDRASHLDGALRECMNQMRNLKEEHGKKLQEVALSKERLFDKMKLELEGKLFDLDQELLRAAAENAALLRSLEEKSNMVIRLTGEKSQAEAQIEFLKSNAEACGKEMNSLKYELHIARKEAEIRNEEKNMSVRSAEVANKQYLEGVKKIAKLEAECQRLRTLVRKKLPGPAALAQMKLEVDNFGRDVEDSRFKRSSGRPASSNSSKAPEFSPESAVKCIKENELLTERLMAMEEETKVLREALSKRECELQAAQSICALTSSNLHSKEAELQDNGEQLCFMKTNNQPSLLSLSEERNDDNVSTASSWSSGLFSEPFKMGKNVRKSESTNTVDLMDDFLEMEKLANSDVADNNTDVSKLPQSKGSDELGFTSFTGNVAGIASRLQADPSALMQLQFLISKVLESITDKNDQTKVIENVKLLIHGMHACSLLQPLKFANEAEDSSMVVVTTALYHELKSAVAQISEFILILGREAKQVPNGGSLTAKIDSLIAKYLDTMGNDINPVEFVSDISYVFSEANKLHLNVLGSKSSEPESCSPDCIDKIALPETKAIMHFSDTCSDPDISNEAALVPTMEVPATPWKCSLEVFEPLRMDKENLEADLARCMENLACTQMQLKQTEHLLAEAQSQLLSSQKSNSLADVQLKCMTESYKSLESQAEELQREVHHLLGKVQNLENDLQEVRRSHQEALSRCKALQEQVDRVSVSATTGIDEKTCQLAECQETMKLLGKQLDSLGNQQETTIPLKNNCRAPRVVEGSTTSNMNLRDMLEPLDIDSMQSNKHNSGFESPLVDVFSTMLNTDSEMNNFMMSPVRSKDSGFQLSKSGSMPEKQPARGLGRFFSSSTKGKLYQL